jgi:hypothetical protein
MNHLSNSAELPYSAMRIGITPSKIDGETGFFRAWGSKNRVLKFENDGRATNQNQQTKSETQLNNLHYVK